MISSVCDAATVRLLALAEERFGTSPVPFVFLALGSHGRQEMTLASDQDNAISYRRLTPIEQTLLNQSFAQISAVQKRIGYDFLGGAT